MSTCGCGSTGAYNNCCPSAPDITINETVIEADGLATRMRRQRFAPADIVAGVFTLDYTPVSSEGVQVFLNGSLLRYTLDYTVADGVVTLVNTDVPGDATIDVAYISQEAA